MLVIWILCVSILLQIAAVGLAMRLNWRYGYHLAWVLISAANVVMLGRRLNTLVDYFITQSTASISLEAETLYIVVSILMVSGIALIGPLFQRLKDAEAAGKHREKDLSTEVEIRVAELRAQMAEREKAEQAVREGVARQRAIFEAALDCILISDSQGKIVEINHAAEKMFGYRARDVVGKEMDALIFPPALRKRQRDNLERYAETGEQGSLLGRRLEVQTVRKNGEVFTAEMAMQPIHLEESVLVVVFLRDIQKRKEAEDALEQERFLLQTLMENLPHSIYFKDTASHFLRISRALAKRFGLKDPAAAVGKSDFNFFTESHARRARRDEQELMSSGKPVLDIQEEETWPDGSTTWVSTSKLPLYDSLGRVAGTFGISRDITEQKRTEEALRESEFRTRSIVESAYDAFVAMDETGSVVDWNAAAVAIFGWSRVEAIGQQLSELIIPISQRSAHRAGLERYLQTGEGPLLNRRLEVSACKKDGTEIPVELTITPLRLRQKHLFCAFIHDISLRKVAEQALRDAKVAAESANQAKGDFLANMSHEIRTPLNAVIGMTDLLLETGLRGTQREYLEMVRDSGEALLGVINDILDFSKIEAGKLDLDEVPFRLRDVLGDSLKLLGVRAHKKGLELACDIDVNVPDSLEGDPGRLRQIVINLVGNAIKFTDQGEVVVDVTADAPRDGRVRVHVAVTDTGIGIPRQKLEKIFRAFEQADTSTTRRFGGTGLGLSISSRLVELMGGRIEVESEEGQGSTFRFSIDLPLTQQTAGTPMPVSTQLRDLRILVVDDNATNRRILEEMLRNWGLQPILANGAPQALRVLEDAGARGRPFDVILTDAHMPGTDGFTLAQQVRNDPRISGAVMMMLTSGDRPGDLARCEELKISRYLLKPIKQSELFDSLSRAVSGSDVPDLSAVSGGPRKHARSLNVLLAEDSTVNQKLAIGLLQMWGHKITTVDNGRDAVRLAAEPFDLILMDVQMPEMDGLEATEEIRKLEQRTGTHMPIIAMTAHAMKGDRDRCLAAGMDRYIAKPIRAVELFQEIKDLCPAGEEPAATSGDGAATRSPGPVEAENRTHPLAPVATASGRDWSAALKNVQGDKGLFRDVAEAFLLEGPELQEKMTVALQDRDAERLRRAAHTLKGGLRTVGGEEAAEAVVRIEDAARRGVINEAVALFPGMQEEHARFRKELTEYLHRLQSEGIGSDVSMPAQSSEDVTLSSG